MKLLSLLLVLFSFSAFADQTCLTSTYEFRITKHFIEATDGIEEIRIPYSDVRSISINNRNNFDPLIHRLSDDFSTDVVLSKNEMSRITRFSLTLADGTENLIRKMMYIKAFDKYGLLIARFMLIDQSNSRCL